MDRRDAIVETGHDEAKASPSLGSYVIEDGRKYRMPYTAVRKATFSNLSRTELVDVPHSARLQYRLMLLAAVIKAVVDFDNAQITIIYNPSNADNASEKTTFDGLVKMLSKEGVHAGKSDTGDYDYYKEFYTSSHNPETIKESPPYGYTANEWSAMKSRWQKKMAESAARKMEKFRRWQEAYLNSKPNITQKIEEERKKEAK